LSASCHCNRIANTATTNHVTDNRTIVNRLQVLPAVNKVVSLFNNRNKQPALRSLLQVGPGILPDSILGVSTGNSQNFAGGTSQQQQPLRDGQWIPGATALPGQMTSKGLQQLQTMIGAAQKVNTAVTGSDAFSMNGYDFRAAGDGVGFDFTIMDDMLGPISGPTKPADRLASGAAAGAQSAAAAMLPNSGMPGLENYYAGYTAGSNTLGQLVGGLQAGNNPPQAAAPNTAADVMQLQQPQQQFMMQQLQQPQQLLQQQQQQQQQAAAAAALQQQQQQLLQQQQQQSRFGPDLAAIQDFQHQRQQQQQQQQQTQPPPQQQQPAPAAATLESSQQQQQSQLPNMVLQPTPQNSAAAAAAAAAESGVVITPGYPAGLDPTAATVDPAASTVIYYDTKGHPSAYPIPSSSGSNSALPQYQTGSSSSSSTSKQAPWTWANLGLESAPGFPASRPASFPATAGSRSSSSSSFNSKQLGCQTFLRVFALLLLPNCSSSSSGIITLGSDKLAPATVAAGIC
jgi:hypothetical protein